MPIQKNISNKQYQNFKKSMRLEILVGYTKCHTLKRAALYKKDIAHSNIYLGYTVVYFHGLNPFTKAFGSR